MTNLKVGKKLLSLVLAIITVLSTVFIAVGVSAASGDTIFIKANNGWSDVYVYAWNSPSDVEKAWPGTKAVYQEASSTQGTTYKHTFSKNYKYVIFNNGKGQQTPDLTYTGNGGNGKMYDLASCRWMDYYQNGTTMPNTTVPATTKVTTTKATTSSASSYTVYYYNSKNWSNVYAYMWNSTSDTMSAWPGKAMTNIGNGYYSITTSKKYNNIIFSNKGSDQTKDLTAYPGYCYVPNQNVWSKYATSTTTKATTTTKLATTTTKAVTTTTKPVATTTKPVVTTTKATEPTVSTTQSTNNTIYFKNDKGWSTVKAYMWNSTSDTYSSWPGVSMTNLGNGYYSITPSKKYNNIIFNNGSGTQTADLTANYGYYYSTSSNTWAKYSGSTTPATTTTATTTQPFQGTALVGTFNNWTIGANPTETAYRGYKATITLAKGSYEFKFVSVYNNNTIWYGADNAVVNNETTSSISVKSPGANIKLNITNPGDYTVTYRVDTSTISVTKVIPETTQPTTLAPDSYFYFKNTLNWNKVYAYVYNSDTDYMVAKPGVLMEHYDEDYYKINVNSKYKYVDFTDGEGHYFDKQYINLKYCFVPSDTFSGWQYYNGNITKYIDVKLKKGYYTYSGSRIEPSVSVTYGNQTLVKGVDYVVNCTNNTLVGMATATIRGIGKYSGTETVEYSITPATIYHTKGDFIFGKDNFGFINSYYDFTGVGSSTNRKTYKQLMDKEYYDLLSSKLKSDVYWQYTENEANNNWRGSCYGMSVLMALSYHGYLPISEIQPGATTLYQLKKPSQNSKVGSLINYYYLIQIAYSRSKTRSALIYKDKKTQINTILDAIDKYEVVPFSIKFSDTGHSMVAYDYETSTTGWIKNNKTYYGRIKVCNPNSTVERDGDYIYYNPYDNYDYTITNYNYSNLNIKGVYASLRDLNEYGAIGTPGVTTSGFGATVDTSINSEDFAATIDEEQIGTEHSIENLSNKNADEKEIIEDDSYNIESNNKMYYLEDTDASYKVSQETAQPLELTMNYEDSMMQVYSSKGTSAAFDEDGMVKLTSEAGAYRISLTADEHPTDWFTVKVSGSNASNAKLTKAANGYVLTASNLNNVTVDTNNRNDSATTTFSTSYNKVLIYEVNKTTIGIKVDADNNGTFETVIK